MQNERLEEILGRILTWATEHDDEFVNDIINASRMTNEELNYFDMEDYVDVEKQRQRKKYLINKSTWCSLDEEESEELYGELADIVL